MEKEETINRAFKTNPKNFSEDFGIEEKIEIRKQKKLKSDYQKSPKNKVNNEYTLKSIYKDDLKKNRKPNSIRVKDKSSYNPLDPQGNISFFDSYLHQSQLSSKFTVRDLTLNNETNHDLSNIEFQTSKIKLEMKKASLVNQLKNLSNDVKPKIYIEKNECIPCFVTSSFKNFKKENTQKISISLSNLYKKDKRQKSKVETIKGNFFGIYDGFESSQASLFLQENLAQMILKNSNILDNPAEAIMSSFKNTEENFRLKYTNLISSIQDRHMNVGSSVIICLFMMDILYVANLGDSRTVISQGNFSKILQLSKDHKVSDPLEKNRIIINGGNVQISEIKCENLNEQSEKQMLVPSGLTVSRTFGCFEAKKKEKSGVIISKPDILSVRIDKNFDFLLMANNNVYEFQRNSEITEKIVSTAISCLNLNLNLAEFLEETSNEIFKQSILKGSQGNLSLILICFENFKENYEKKNYPYFENYLMQIQYDKPNVLIMEGLLMKRFIELDENVEFINPSIIIDAKHNSRSQTNLIIKKKNTYFCCNFFFCIKKKKG